MRNAIITLIFGLHTLFAAQFANASDSTLDTPEQKVVLTASGKHIDEWLVKSNEIKSFTLPNGFKLGIKIEPADQEFYKEHSELSKDDNEYVKITLYDVSGKSPKLLTYTWGGTNSTQGYGAQGGADRVVEVGSPGIILTLNNR